MSAVKRRDKGLELDRVNGDMLDLVKADKSADGFFRIMMAKHQSLSAMADNKAHLMLTICAGIIGFTFKQLFDPVYVYAAGTLIASSALAAGLAVYATMPKLGAFGTVANPHDPHFNLIFFSDFARMPYEAFEHEMELMLRDQRRIHRSMIKDLYSLGKILHEKKYRYLGYCYRVFVGGLLLSAIVLAVSLMTLQQP